MTITAPPPLPRWVRPWSRIAESVRLDRRQPMPEWAEKHVHVAKGPAPGKWRNSTFPLMSAAMRLADEPWVREVTICGPNRSGKTQVWIVNPLLRDLAEGREVLLLSTNDELALKSWNEIKAGMQRSPSLRRLLLPARLAGTKDSRRFSSGAVLHISGAGSIGQLASFNAEKVYCTEVSNYASEYGDKDGPIAQARARSDAFRLTRKIVRESVVAGPDGLIWQDLLAAGCVYRPAVRCPHCGMEQNLLADTDDGWTPADPSNPIAMQGRGGVRWSGSSPDEAERSAYYICPSPKCAAVITEAERQAITRAAEWKADRPGRHSHIAMHYGALFLPWESLGGVARDLCTATRKDSPTGQRYVLQDRLALPVVDVEAADENNIAARFVAGRTNGLPEGTAPAGTARITGFIDINAGYLSWCCIAWRPGAAGSVIAYSQEKVDRPIQSLRNPSDQVRQAEELAIWAALARLRDRLAAGFRDTDGRTRGVDLVLVDVGWDLSAPVVYQFVADLPAWLPAKGFGRDVVSWRMSAATLPKHIIEAGDNWRIAALPEGQTLLANADHWKSVAHQGFAISPGEPGSLTLFGGDPAAHADFSEQVTAERFRQPDAKFRRGRWEEVRKANHYLDCVSGCRCAAEVIGLEILESVQPGRNAPVGPDPVAALAAYFGRPM